PEFAMVSGLVRTVTSENASLDFRVIDFDVDNTEVNQIAAAVVKVAEKQSLANEEDPERELCISNGKSFISRLVRNRHLNTIFAPDHPESRKFSTGNRVIAGVSGGKVAFHEVIAEEDVQAESV